MKCNFGKDQLHKLLDMQILEASLDYARVSMAIHDNIRDGMGVVHGGALFALADTAFGIAANCDEKQGPAVTTVSDLCYLSPGRIGPFVAEARRLKHDKQLMYYAIDVYDGNGVRIAHGGFQGFRMHAAPTHVVQ